MLSIENLAQSTIAVAEDVALNPTLNIIGADLILRNLAVASGRISPEQFAELSPETTNNVLGVLLIADNLSPTSDTDNRRFPGESIEECDYRVTIIQPLHALQTHISNARAESLDKNTQKYVRTAVIKAGTAFAGIITELEHDDDVRKSVRYFSGNTHAARKHMS